MMATGTAVTMGEDVLTGRNNSSKESPLASESRTQHYPWQLEASTYLRAAGMTETLTPLVHAGVKRLHALLVSSPLLAPIVSHPAYFLAVSILLLLPFSALLATVRVAPDAVFPLTAYKPAPSALPPPPYHMHPLNSTAVTSLFDCWMGRFPPDRVPWSGMLGGDTAFRPDAKYLYFRRGMDSCVGFIHYTASLRCRVVLAERLNRTLVVDAVFCTASAHSRDKRGRMKPLYAYYDMSVVRA